MNFDMNPGEKIKEIRKRKNITQEQLAKKLGVKRSVISKYENGTVNMTLKTMLKIAMELDVSVDDFISENEEPKPNNDDERDELIRKLETLSDESLIALEEFLNYLLLKEQRDAHPTPDNTDSE